jgi:hypothetical protein
VKEARVLALVAVSVLISVSFSFPLQSAAARVGPAPGTLYLSYPTSSLPAPCSGWASGLNAEDVGTLSQSVPAAAHKYIDLYSGYGTWSTAFCTNEAFAYPPPSSISSVAVTLRIADASEPWVVAAYLYDLGTVAGPASAPVQLASGSANFATFSRGDTLPLAKAFTFSLTPVAGSKLASGHVLGLELVIGGYQGGLVDLVVGSYNPLWTSVTSVSIR